RVIPITFIDRKKLHERLQVLQYRDFRNARKPWGKLTSDLQAAAASRLTVHLAIWGPGKMMKNCTTKVKKEVSAGNLSIAADKALLGDPIHGELKRLTIVYSAGGEVEIEEVEEHEIATLHA